MNMKDILIPVALAFAVTWAFQYFFGSRQPVEPETKGQKIAIDQGHQLPILKEVTISEQEISRPAHIATINTPHATLQFSSQGAILQSLVFHRQVDHKQLDLETISSPASLDQACFLVAFADTTPLSYELVDQTDTPEQATLIYRAQAKEGVIEKVFNISKATYKVDLKITIKPHHSVQPRLLVSSPLLAGMARAEHLGGIIEEQGHALTRYKEDRNLYELKNSYWSEPTLFGSEDRYFVHAMINDAQQFAQRGYYKAIPGRLIAIIEGPQITKETSWNLSFYFGPKEHEAFVAVDSRLEELLDYGWLAPLSKPMLAFMKWMNGYVHNFGLTIILLTILIRLLLLPLTIRGTKGAEKMREMNKKLQYIKHKYKDDPEALQREQAELYQKYGLAGFGGLLGGGCLPLLLQLPVFFAINRVLSSSIELYKAPFLWIADLSTRDPYYVFPLLVAVSMALTTLSTQDMQQRISGFIMAVVFGAFSVGFSAGLSLYIFASTLLGVGQTYLQKALKL